MPTKPRTKKAPLPEEVMRKVALKVHTSSGESFDLPMGEVNEGQAETVNQVINIAFGTLSSNRDLKLIDENGRVYHFNVDRVTCVEVVFG